MGKNVAVFVDVANIFYAAKAAGVDIDYVTLLKSATAGRDFVRAYAYTGLDPDNENQRNFHSFLARNHYKVVSKDIRKYGDGKVKANLDIELVVDLMKTARNLDVAIVVSGDGDFAPAIRAVQEMGVRVEVISFRGNTSSDLIEVADLFTDITQLARVEKGSSRSGRRVASDGEEDLSMTEVPDKQTEGTGTSRGRGRGRGRGRAAPEAAEPATRASSSGNGLAAASLAASGLTVLPGEKLSRAGSAAAGGGGDVGEEAPAAHVDTESTPFDAADDAAGGDEARRRRRRRGGRGRGRGRGREEAGFAPEGGFAQEGAPAVDAADEFEEDEDVDVATAPRGPRPTPFGSVWDSQLGVASSRPSPLPPPPADADEDFDEPEIPEYLIAEQRRGQTGQGNRGGRTQGGRGGRGARAAYGAALDRERFGRGGSGGINRYPDVGDRGRTGGGRQQQPQQQPYGRGDRPPRQDRPDRDRQQPARHSSSEPWSEVPEELEAVLRAQLAQSGKAGPRPVSESPSRADSGVEPAQAVADTASAAPKTRTRRTSTRTTTTGAASPEAPAETPAPKRRTTRAKAAATAPSADEAPAIADNAEPATAKRPSRSRSTTATKSKATSTRSAAAAAETPAESGDAAEATAPKRRTTRKKAEPA
ncbi:MAG: NYN domain-containing protein [Chloroflexota bacterium]